MPVKVIITKTLEDWWGADDIVADYPDKEQRDAGIIELCMEDTVALLDGAQWEVAVEQPVETSK